MSCTVVGARPSGRFKLSDESIARLAQTDEEASRDRSKDDQRQRDPLRRI